MDEPWLIEYQQTEQALAEIHALTSGLIADICHAWQGEDAAAFTSRLSALNDHIASIAAQMRTLL